MDARFFEESLIAVFKKHGLEKLREVLNYHYINNKQNLLTQSAPNTSLDNLKTICKQKSTDTLPELDYELYSEYSPILEYCIVETGVKTLKFILDEITLDPTKSEWNYTNRTLNFGQKDDNRIFDVVVATISKISIETEIKPQVLDNFFYVLDRIYDRITFKTNPSIVLIVLLNHRKVFGFMEKVINYVKSHTSDSEQETIAAKLEYYYQIPF